jgi:hypothetical protein
MFGNFACRLNFSGNYVSYFPAIQDPIQVGTIFSTSIYFNSYQGITVSRDLVPNLDLEDLVTFCFISFLLSECEED